MNHLIFKRGDTFSYAGVLPASFFPTPGWTVRSQLRDLHSNNKIELETTLEIQPNGSWLLRLFAPATSTQNWPLARYAGDVEFRSADTDPTVVSSADFFVQVVEDRTHD